MKQISDEVFAQVREALLGYSGDLGRDPSDVPALAALDTAQPVQVNVMLVEALEKLQRHDFEMRSKTGDGFAPYVVRIIDDAVAAAKQAQPDGINDVYLKGYEAGKQAQPEPIKDHETAKLVNDLTAIACEFHNHQSLRERIAQLVRPWAKGAQPERAPLDKDTIAEIAHRMEAEDCDDIFWVEFARAIEAAIKQGGQQ